MLKSKLKKLALFKKWRQDSTGMGNCAGSSTKEGRGERAAGRSKSAAEVSKYTHGELVLK